VKLALIWGVVESGALQSAEVLRIRRAVLWKEKRLEQTEGELFFAK